MDTNNNTDIKYAPLYNKVTIDEQKNIAKYNNNNTENETKILRDDKNESILLPEIKFSVPLQSTSSAIDAIVLNSNNNNNNNTTNNDLDEDMVYTKTSVSKGFKIEKLYLFITSILSFIILSLIIFLMYKSAIINRLDISFKQQKKDYDALKLKYKDSIDFTNTTNPKNNNTKMCLTDNCILLSGNIYSSLDTSVDPCEDFYEYSCGNWLKKTLIPRGYPRWSTIVSRSYANQLVLKDELEKYSFINSTQDNSSHDLINAEVKAVLFYKSCIDNDGYIEELKAQPFLKIVNKFLYKNENNSLVFNDTFENILYDVHIKFGLAAYFQMGVMDDDKNSSYNDIEITQGSISLDRSYYLNMTIEKNKKAVETLAQTFKNILNLMYGDIKDLDSIMDNFLKFETKMAEIMIPYEKLSNIEDNYQRISLKNLTENIAPFIDWQTFLKTYLKNYNSSVIVKEDDTIIVLGYEYFLNLTTFLNEYNQTEGKRFILKFSMFIHLLKFSLPLLSSEYRLQLSILNEAITGATLNDRWQHCIDHVDATSTLGFAVGRMFVKKKFNKAQSTASEMIKRIRDSFTANFPSIAWMDEETRHLAEEKIKSVTELIGYPNFIMNDTEINNKYKDLEIIADDYFGNEVKFNTFALKNEILQYRQHVKKEEWDMTPATVNAYYVPTRNQIVFPAGILQEPFFSLNYPQSVNFGGIGFIMGHELSHGFDDSGREYNKNGILSPWWNNQTIEAYSVASDCIAQQYSDYKINGENLNGKITLGENIADNGALKTSYNAYIQWIEENGEELPLPLLNLTHKQLFFVSFAQTWCTKSTPDSVHLFLSIDSHSPPRYRVIGSVVNSVEFSKNFNCKPGSKMNPNDKCSIF